MALQAPDRFTVRWERCDGLSLQTVAGHVSGTSPAEIAQVLATAPGPLGRTVVLDLAQTVGIDEHGVTALLWLQRELGSTGRELVLHRPSTDVLARLRRAGLRSPLSTSPAPPARSSVRRRAARR